MTRVLARTCLAAVLSAVGAASAAAQGTTGSISGFVTDDTNAALPGATVTVRLIETDQRRVVVTDGAGRFTAQALSPGRYDVSGQRHHLPHQSEPADPVRVQSEPG